jgi:predicted site-specific integrase-resolvase
VKLSHWARKHGMGYLTVWRWFKAGGRSAKNRAKRAPEVMGCG